MCGRFTMATSGEIIADVFGLSAVPKLAPRYNIAPTQDVAAIRCDEGSRRALMFLRWGLIPSWASDAAIGNRMINARAETLAEKPAFRAALRSRRCLVIADGFYEWQKLGARKQPHLVRFRDGRPFAFAGLWERWQPGTGDTVESCTIVTTAANEVVAPVHDRMPVILDETGIATWLDPGGRDAAALAHLLTPFAAGEMEAFPVGLLVNNPANDVSQCRDRLR